MDTPVTGSMEREPEEEASPSEMFAERTCRDPDSVREWHFRRPPMKKGQEHEEPMKISRPASSPSRAPWTLTEEPLWAWLPRVPREISRPESRTTEESVIQSVARLSECRQERAHTNDTDPEKWHSLQEASGCCPRPRRHGPVRPGERHQLQARKEGGVAAK